MCINKWQRYRVIYYLYLRSKFHACFTSFALIYCRNCDSNQHKYFLFSQAFTSLLITKCNIPILHFSLSFFHTGVSYYIVYTNDAIWSMVKLKPYTHSLLNSQLKRRKLYKKKNIQHDLLQLKKQLILEIGKRLGTQKLNYLTTQIIRI